MTIELDHLFVCTEVGAPEANRLIELGFTEGPPNTHPGQGTANRRFFFANSMIELLWVSDPEEARRAPAGRTQLWERWSGRRTGASPFGIVVRPVGSTPSSPPFPSWKYRPDWLAKDLVVHVGNAGLDEPMWVYMDFLSRVRRHPKHSNGVSDITRIHLTTPAPLGSTAARAIVDNHVLSHECGAEHLITIEFDRGIHNLCADLRPDLPVILRY